MKSIFVFVCLAALAASSEGENGLLPWNDQGLDQIGAAIGLGPLEDQSENIDTALLKKAATELRAECLAMIGEVYENEDNYPAEKLQELKEAIEAKLKVAVETAWKYRAALRKERDTLVPTQLIASEERVDHGLSQDGVIDLSEEAAKAPGVQAASGGQRVGLDQVLSLEPTQRGIVSITGPIPDVIPKKVNWQDVPEIDLTASRADPADLKESDDALVAEPSSEHNVETRATAQDGIVGESWEATMHKILSASNQIQPVDQAKVREFVKKHVTAGFPELKRRLEATEISALGAPIDSTIIYFKVQKSYDTLYFDKVKMAKDLTPRTLLSWLDSLAQSRIVWVDGASEVTLGQVWDYLVESRSAALPNQETTATADAYNEAFWFKGIVTSQVTRSQHILGYSVFQLQVRAQLDAKSSPAEAHGNWPWFTNQQILEMVKQYDIEAHASTPAAVDVPQIADENVEPGAYQLAGALPNKELSISDEVNKVVNAQETSEALRASLELLRAGMPVEMMQDLPADNLEQLNLAYNSMLSERALQAEQGKPQTRGLWPWVSWEDLINIANPSSSGGSEVIDAAEIPDSIKRAANDRGFSDEQLHDLDADQMQMLVQLHDKLIEDQRSALANEVPQFRGIWPWFSWDDLINMARFKTTTKPRRIDQGQDAFAFGENEAGAGLSPEQRFERKRTEVRKHHALTNGQVAHPPTMALPAEVMTKIMEANEQLSVARAEAASHQLRPTIDVADMPDQLDDAFALESLTDLRGPIKHFAPSDAFVSVDQPKEEEVVKLSPGDRFPAELFGSEVPKASSAEGLDLGQALTQLQVLDSMLS